MRLEKRRRKLLLAGSKKTGAGSEKSRAHPSGQILKAVETKLFPNKNGFGVRTIQHLCMKGRTRAKNSKGTVIAVMGCAATAT